MEFAVNLQSPALLTYRRIAAGCCCNFIERCRVLADSARQQAQCSSGIWEHSGVAQLIFDILFRLYAACALVVVDMI